jgi:sterol desaturase/sphingolipid hydroxylase (fatty acid hydroxylase superfamily)
MAVGITRVAFEVACWAGPIGLPLARLWYGWWGVLVWTCLEGLTIVGDYFISPKMENNLTRLERIGYSRTQLYVLMYANLFWPNALIAGLQQIFCGGSAPWNTMDVRIDAQLISIIAVNLVLADVFFTLAHSIVLHKTKFGASFHKIHHCAKPCSWSSNLIFHPVDMAIEFTPSTAVALAVHYVTRDPFALCVFMTIGHLWYFVDHSDLIKTQHYRHHEKVDASYGIYTTGKHMKAIYNRFANAGLRAEIDLADKGTRAQ